MIFVDLERYCEVCKIHIKKNKWTSHLKTNAHKLNCFVREADGIEVVRSAFKQRIVSYKITPKSYTIDIPSFQEEIKKKVVNLIRKEQEKHICVKVNLELFGVYFSAPLDLTDVKSFNTKFEVVVAGTNIEELYDKLFATIGRKADELAERESGK